MAWKHTIITMATAILVATPMGAASWSAFGNVEPDNAEDSPAFNFQDAPGVTTNRVYFNGWTQFTGANANPNVAALSTRNEVATGESYAAILGVWADCNGDGYIGMLETAVREYDAALLTDTSVCPPATGTDADYAFQFNWNGWVSELIPIGGSGGNTNGDTADDGRDLRIVRDHDAKVWADFGIWNEVASATQGTCALTPQPRGTYQSTGGILNFIECSPGLLERWNQIFRDGVRVGGEQVLQGLDPNNEQGLHWTNDDNANQPGHPLYRPTLGSEHSDRSAVYYSDCSAPETFNSTTTTRELLDPLGWENVAGQNVKQRFESGTFPFVVNQPDVRLGDLGGATIPGTMNATREEVPADGIVVSTSADCNYDNDNGGDTYEGTCQVTGSPCVGEGSFEGSSNQEKRSARLNFAFGDGMRGKRGLTGVNNSTWEDLNVVLPGVFPHDGYSGMHGGAGRGGGDWAGGVALIKTTGPRTAAVNIDNGTVDIARAYYVTYYAFVGENVTSAGYQLPGGSGVYGSAQCGSETSGIWNGWNCDPDTWYREQNTGNLLPGTERFARPGQPYQLRDVDCHDGGNGLGVPLGLPALGSRACVPP